MESTRLSEWFVPKFGSKNFRLSVGILFLPYTGMVVSFAIWGSLIVDFTVERLIAICLVYFFGIGIGAHGLDAISGKLKPWGTLPRKKIKIISLIALIVAFSIGYYYAFLDSYLLFPISIIEGFFVFAYNLELFNGRFHNNLAFVISWGVLPVLAGTVIQINSITLPTIVLSFLAAILSFVLIKTSRKYKKLKHEGRNFSSIKNNEIILKIISIGTISCTSIFLFIKIFIFL